MPIRSGSGGLKLTLNHIRESKNIRIDEELKKTRFRTFKKEFLIYIIAIVLIIGAMILSALLGIFLLN